MNLLKNVGDLFIPKRCLHCQCIITRNVKFLCSDCNLQIAHTGFFNYPNNALEKMFWGRINISVAASLYFYQKNSPIQTLLRKLKYKGLQQIGLFFANSVVAELQLKNRFKQVDIIIPIPLHPKKEKKRGYNQVDLFGKKIAEHLTVPFVKDGLIRIENNKSQTKQNKEERHHSVKNSYKANTTYNLNKKHILIIDDVVTTGATFIACCKTLQNKYDVDISVITIACVV